MKEANQRLISSMAKLGYPMMEPVQELNVNQTLAEVVKSQEIRYWEGFPILLSKASENFLFEPELIEQLMDSEAQKRQFRALMILSGSLFSHYHLSSSWWQKFKKDFSETERRLFKTFSNSLSHNGKLKWDGIELDSERLKKLFELYFENKKEKTERQKQKYEEFSLEFALSKIFSPKQKELFKKKLDGLPLNKTEQEYYSRTVKKKVIALANIQLHNMARRLIEQ